MIGVIELEWFKLDDDDDDNNNDSLFSKYDDDDLSTPGAKSTFFTPIPLVLTRSSVYDSFASSLKLLLAFIEKLLLLSFSWLLDNDDVSVIGEAPRFTVSAPVKYIYIHL